MPPVRSFFRVAAISLFLFIAPGDSGPPGKTLEISETNAKLLDHIGDYTDLEVLSISCLEDLKSLPDAIGKLTELKELRIDNGSGCAMNPILPETIGNLRSLENLVLYGAQDPRPVGKHFGPQPTERHNFPLSMSQLKNLRYLNLGRNGFDAIPSFVKDLPKLRELDFEWNIEFKEVPAFITNLQELETLKLAGNDLDDLPQFLNALPRLNRITLGNNCKITQNAAKMKDLKIRFPRVTFDFEDEYDCPAK
jgi:Leucine-rich repeat (LRR) protein